LVVSNFDFKKINNLKKIFFNFLNFVKNDKLTDCDFFFYENENLKRKRIDEFEIEDLKNLKFKKIQ
jgi:hypothetical protein